MTIPEPMKIGYTCSYVPVEILALTGHRPYRLLHGDRVFSDVADRHLRIDACPLIKSSVGYLIENQHEFAAVVGSSGCDMARRMFDIIGEETDIKIYVIDVPRTDRPDMYCDEIDWLFAELECLAGKKFSEAMIATEVRRWEKARALMKTNERRRGETPSRLSTAAFHRLATGYHMGAPESIAAPAAGDPSDKPRVYLVGSAVPYEGNEILELFEKYVRIVGDLNCGISRFTRIAVREPTLGGIKQAYLHQPPCIFRRPNTRYYDAVAADIQSLSCRGVLAWILDYCDNYDFEMNFFERRLDIPLLKIKSDFSRLNASQVKLRVEAFAEMLAGHG